MWEQKIERDMENMSVAGAGDSIVLWHLTKSSIPTEEYIFRPSG